MMRRIGTGLVFAVLLAGCGRVGFPVPPDDYGIGVRIQEERKKEEQARKEQEARRETSTQAREAAARQKAEEEIVTPPDEFILPDMRPVGGR